MDWEFNDEYTVLFQKQLFTNVVMFSYSNMHGSIFDKEWIKPIRNIESDISRELYCDKYKYNMEIMSWSVEIVASHSHVSFTLNEKHEDESNGVKWITFCRLQILLMTMNGMVLISYRT